MVSFLQSSYKVQRLINILSSIVEHFQLKLQASLHY